MEHFLLSFRAGAGLRFIPNRVHGVVLQRRQRQDVEFLTIHPSLYTTALQIFARIKKNARITVPLFIAILCLIMRSCYSRRSFGAEPW